MIVVKPYKGDQPVRVKTSGEENLHMGIRGTKKFPKSPACSPKYSREYKVQPETMKKASRSKDQKLKIGFGVQVEIY